MKQYYNVKNYARTIDVQELPSLIDIQLQSFEDFLHGGKLLELFDEINPIQSFNQNLSLYLPGNHPEAKNLGLEYHLKEPKYDEEECIERDMSYARALHVGVALINHANGDEIVKQDIFFGEFPVMTAKGTFIINGVERVVVSQLIRSPGVYFSAEEERTTGRKLSTAKLIPDRGAWMEFETRKTNTINIKFNRQRTIPVTILLRALAAVDDGLPSRNAPIQSGETEEILKLFAHADTNAIHPYIESSLRGEPEWEVKKNSSIAHTALIEFFKRLRPGDPATLDNARDYLQSQLFDTRRYDLGRVGRYKLNQRLALEAEVPLEHRTITKWDIVKLVEQMIYINNGERLRDNIDHLGNRRVKTVGELVGNKLRIGLRRMERVVKERMSIRDADNLTPVTLVNIRPIVAAVREFFGSSQLSQFMEQTNPLSELTHKRTLSALGPGGLRRERAGFEVRDVHHSHYGRICPIETPEGPNIGLIGRLASYARVNPLGFIETPYRKVLHSLPLDDPRLLNLSVQDDIEQTLRLNAETVIDDKVLAQIKLFGVDTVTVLADGVAEAVDELPVDKALEGRTLSSEIASLIDSDAELHAHILAACQPYVEGAPIDSSALASASLTKKVRRRLPYSQLVNEIIDITGLFLAAEDDDDDATNGEQAAARAALEKELQTILSQFRAVSRAKAGTKITRNLFDGLQRFNIPQAPVKAQPTVADILSLPVAELRLGQTLAAELRRDDFLLAEEGELIDQPLLDRLALAGFTEIAVKPFVTQDISYLSADAEDRYIIAQANAELNAQEQFVSQRVSARHEQEFITVHPRRIDYMDVAPRQIVGISAALIPFLSHDAANRALMGSNMQRQAVPLIAPDVSVVSTGMERQAASDSGQVLVSEVAATVDSVQGHRVKVSLEDGEEKVFQLRKYERSNQSTCIDQRPIVRKGDTIQPGDIIADSSSTQNGHLALGQDVLTCFLSWDGGNYEDALLVSEDLLRQDKFTSIHIEKYEIEARDTKLGAEEITYDIPNVGDEALKDLGPDGIVRIGAEVGPNDILVGKITPKGEKELSPEEKLLRAIFGEQAREVRDSSLRLPHGDRGKVIDVKVFNREDHPDLPAGVEKMVRVSVAQSRRLTVGDKMAGRHGNKGVISNIVSVEDMPYIEGGKPIEIILNPLGVPSRMNIGQILELELGWAADRLGFRAITPVFDGAEELEIKAELGRAWLITWAMKAITARAWEAQKSLAARAGIEPDDFDDDMHVICAYLYDSLADDSSYDIAKIISERDPVYVRRVAVAEILREHGYRPEEFMVYDNSGLSEGERAQRDQLALEVSLRLWIQDASAQYIATLEDGEYNRLQDIELSPAMSQDALFEVANEVMFASNMPVPHYGKQVLYDGRTGEPFDKHVAVGYVHMLKLAHLVEDKAHARSTGPYSLVTQQPLGGKAQFGGQRFGEMEVWALEAYGAAHILQEMLTVKSDDVQGRVKTYESIVKGDPIEEPGIPTSFHVLVKELQSLGLSVEAITSTNEVVRFGKNAEQSRRAWPQTGLLGLSTAR